jgi:hypothetical protein
VPPYGIILQNGGFKSAGVNFVFGVPIPPPQLFPGVYLDEIGAAVQLNPVVLLGHAKLDVVGLAGINSVLLTAFPSGDAPFTLTSDWLPGIPGSLNGQVFYSSPLVGVSGDVSVHVPVIGDLTLGHGYLVYADPGYLWAGGSIDFNVLGGLLKWGGGVDGAFNSQTHAFDVEGYVYGSIADVISGSLHAVVSSQGAGACADVAGVLVGGGVQWARVDRPYIYPWGCVFDRFTEDHVFGAADVAQAQRPFTIRIAPGDVGRVIRLEGRDGAPAVQVSGPGGATLTSPAGAGLTHTGAHLAIIRSLKLKMTAIGLHNPAPGTYTVAPLPGSPVIATVETALAPPPAHITAQVVGTGPHRALVYDIANRPDQTVTFFEVNSEGLWRQIGAVTGGGRGHLGFTATPDKHDQRIIAQFALHGMPVPGERITVARLRPPPITPLPAPRGLRVGRMRAALIVSWRAVPGAARYAVVVRQPVGGARLVLVPAARHSVHISGLDPASGGVATVLALSQSGARGARSHAPFKAVPKAAPPPHRHKPHRHK